MFSDLFLRLCGLLAKIHLRSYAFAAFGQDPFAFLRLCGLFVERQLDDLRVDLSAAHVDLYGVTDHSQLGGNVCHCDRLADEGTVRTGSHVADLVAVNVNGAVLSGNTSAGDLQTHALDGGSALVKDRLLADEIGGYLISLS